MRAGDQVYAEINPFQRRGPRYVERATIIDTRADRVLVSYHDDRRGTQWVPRSAVQMKSEFEAKRLLRIRKRWKSWHPDQLDMFREEDLS